MTMTAAKLRGRANRDSEAPGICCRMDLFNDVFAPPCHHRCHRCLGPDDSAKFSFFIIRVVLRFESRPNELQKNMRKYTSINIHRSEVHCRCAVRFGQVLPGFLITAHLMHLCCNWVASCVAA